jgi:hypothetical protein
MGVGLAILSETKLSDDYHPCPTSGYMILASKATSHNQGGIALLWKENHLGYEVDWACIVMPSLLTFHLITGNEKFYCMSIYIPPIDTMGVDDLRASWEACPAGSIRIVLGDLNIDLRDPRNKQEELIVNLLYNINLIDTSRRFAP